MSYAYKWSTDCSVKFVEEYGKHPCLWDNKDKEYKNKKARNTAMQEIVEAMNIEGFNFIAAKKKLRIIRSTYWNEHTKIRNSWKCGDEIYVPKIPWFAVADKFLRQVSVNWKDNQMTFDFEDSDKSIFPDIKQEIPQEKTLNEKKSKRGVNKRKRKINSPVIVEPAAEPFPDMSDDEVFLKVKEKQSTENEFDSFGRSISMQLQQLPLEDALEVQLEIQGILTGRRLSVLREAKEGQNAKRSSPFIYCDDNYTDEQ